MQVSRRVIEKILKKQKKILGLQDTSNFVFEKLGQGENNINYLLEVDNKRFVLRIALRREGTLQNEHKVLSKIRLPVTPESYLIDTSRQILPSVYAIHEFKPGKHLKVYRKHHLRIHGISLAKLHDATHVKTSDYDIRAFFRKEVREWEASNPEEYHEFSGFILGEIKKHERYFRNIRQSLINTDIVRTNMLYHKGEFSYIDWEWAQVGDPARDFAVFYYPHASLPPWQVRLRPEQLHVYVDGYQSIRKDRSLLKRVHIWHLVIAYMDANYFAWKLKDWHKDAESDLPKSHYIRCKDVLDKMIEEWMRDD